MYRVHFYLVIVCFICSLVVGICLQLPISDSLVSSLITFSGIVFGFLVSAVSALYGTGFAKRLHNEIDKHITIIKQTMLQTLKNYFCTSSTLCLLTIMASIVREFFPEPTKNLIGVVLLGFTISNIIILWLLVKVFLRGLEEEAQ